MLNVDPQQVDDDGRLLRAFLNEGSEEAFCELVGRHGELVSRIVGRRIGEAEAARDVVQTVFCLLARKARNLADHPTVTGWLVRTAIFEAKKHQRKEVNRVKREQRHVVTVAEDQAEAFAEEDFVLVEESLALLPAKFRDAIMMRYYQSDSFKEIGARLGKSEGAAQKTVSRGVEKLRRLVNRRRPSGGELGSSSLVTLLSGALVAGKPTMAMSATAASSIGMAALQSSSSLTKSILLSNTFYTTTAMTVTPLKLVLGLGLVAALPLAYHWHESKNVGETASAASRAAEVQGLPGPSSLLQEQEGQAVTDDETPTVGVVPAASADAGEGEGSLQDQRNRRLINDLKDAEWKIRRGAALAIKEASREVPASMAVPALADVLLDEEWHVRKAAASALASYGTEAAGAVPALIEALEDAEWHVRAPAAEAIGAIGPGAREAVPKLAELLVGDDEWQVRNPVAMALAGIGPEASAAVPALGRALADEQWHVANNAGAALATMGEAAAPVVPELIGALAHEEWHVRGSAAYALGEIGPPASEAIDALTAHLADGEEQVRRLAAEALEKLGAGGSDRE